MSTLERRACLADQLPRMYRHLLHCRHTWPRYHSPHAIHGIALVGRCHPTIAPMRFAVVAR
uniref:Uncharacterized protein n=1 Tax=uncultured marine virus TaxID=186617 RepID=A0A0F7L414_9VIRU|nr:hypothetical protein [uncultured marine virus]